MVSFQYILRQRVGIYGVFSSLSKLNKQLTVTQSGQIMSCLQSALICDNSRKF